MFQIQHFEKEYKAPQSKISYLFKKTLLILLALFLSNFIFNIYIFKTDIKSAVYLNPIAKQIIHDASSFVNSRQNSKNLEVIVSNVLGNDSKNYAVVVFNLETGERYYLNEEKTFETASLYKLWVMAVSYKKIELGEFKQTDVLADSISSINKRFDLTSDPEEDDSQIISWPVENALTNMITISDNYSAYLLTEKVGIDSISKFLQSQGFSNSKVGQEGENPKTSASDIAIYFEKLYKGEFANKEDTNKMINLLKAQKINTKLAKDLPDSAVVAHKTGELGSFSHDAGIVYLPKGDYIIVAMSQTDDQLSANEKIAQISKGVYDYFSKQ